ncbi:hypothetical protein IFM51744_08912 [Aspergillus udagawae]|nr:hypothetical protein IFM51744_08912 [Aspergillus udagawae]GFG16130.1 hypothetical protein IFM5058_07804 [Aspergillus udagawae]
MVYSPQPTDQSPGLLLSFPQEILQSILNILLINEVYTDSSIQKRLSCRVLPFCQIVRKTKSIRGVRSSWANATRSLVFRGKSTRDGLVLKLPRLLSEEGLRTFPLLRDCMVELCHPYSLPELDSLQQDLAKSSVDSRNYICAITWECDDLMDVMRGAVGGMGYATTKQKMVDTFVDECIAAGLKIADCAGHRPNGGSPADSELLEEAAIRSMKNFFFKEVLALWYYNAHIVRQVLSAFPLLEYLVLPDFLHLPFLTRMKYFFPPCTDPGDELSPFSSVNFSPPQMLQTLGITYRENGRRYSDIMASVKVVDISSAHYNPILALFSRRSDYLPSGLLPLLIFNRWRNGNHSEIGTDVVTRLRNHVDKAVSDIPDRKKPRLFDVQNLRNVMNEMYED